jgi:hypothetical protein
MNSEAGPAGVEAAVEAPPKIEQRRPGIRWWWLAAGVISGVLLWTLFRFNPAGNGLYPQCTLYRMTGLLCPGCGGLRASHQLLHGHLREAFALNPLAIAGLPLAIWFAVEPLLRPPDRRWLPKLLTDPTAIALGLGVLAGFTVTRNLPLAAWFGP